MSEVPPAAAAEGHGSFPGWWVVTGCFVVLAVSSGLGFYGLAVYLNAFSNERGWPLSSISLATTLFFVVGGVAGVAVARVIARHDVRIVIVAGAVVGGVALGVLGRVEQQWQLFVVYAVFAAGWAAAGLVPVTTVVTRWFHTRRSVALSVASTGLSGDWPRLSVTSNVSMSRGDTLASPSTRSPLSLKVLVWQGHLNSSAPGV